MARAVGTRAVGTTSKKILPKKRSRSGLILNFISGGTITLQWGNGVTVLANHGIILDTNRSALVLDDGASMYREELHAIASVDSVIAIHEIASD